MPPKYFLKQKLLRTLAGFLLNNGQNSQVLNSGNCISKPISTLSGSIHPIRTIDLKAALEVVIGLGGSTQKASGNVLQRNMTSCSGSSLMGSTELGVRQSKSLNWRSARMLKPNTSSVELSFGGKCVEYCKRVSGNLKGRDARGGNMAYRCLSCNTVGPNSKAGLYMDMLARDFHTSCSSSYSAWTASDVSLDGGQREELGSSSVTTDQKLPCDGTLKLLSGSCYLPHPDKEKTGGEDAHFICTDGRAIGVADGVGGWADHGVDAGKYARELMSNAVSAIQEEPNGSIDPARVLEKAYTSTTAKGSSTACIIALTNKGLHAVNLGDSGFIVVRDGCTVFRSPVQQHDFNFPYQLESGNGSDLPSSAQVFTVSVAPGDVVVAGTDGLFDNLYNNEVTAVIVHAVRAGFEPQVTAQKIAALARQRALDQNRQTPFSTAAQDAGFRYYGGKLDDITVVVSYVKALTA